MKKRIAAFVLLLLFVSAAVAQTVGNRESLNDLGVALSRYWAEQRRVEQIMIQHDRARSNLMVQWEQAGGKPVAIILDGKLYFVDSDGADFLKWTEFPWVITDLTVPPRN
jgi:hypothetical protein